MLDIMNIYQYLCISVILKYIVIIQIAVENLAHTIHIRQIQGSTLGSKPCYTDFRSFAVFLGPSRLISEVYLKIRLAAGWS
jgi:hypothetical protein